MKAFPVPSKLYIPDLSYILPIPCAERSLFLFLQNSGLVQVYEYQPPKRLKHSDSTDSSLLHFLCENDLSLYSRSISSVTNLTCAALNSEEYRICFSIGEEAFQCTLSLSTSTPYFSTPSSPLTKLQDNISVLSLSYNGDYLMIAGLQREIIFYNFFEGNSTIINSPIDCNFYSGVLSNCGKDEDTDALLIGNRGEIVRFPKNPTNNFPKISVDSGSEMQNINKTISYSQSDHYFVTTKDHKYHVIPTHGDVITSEVMLGLLGVCSVPFNFEIEANGNTYCTALYSENSIFFFNKFNEKSIEFNPEFPISFCVFSNNGLLCLSNNQDQFIFISSKEFPNFPETTIENAPESPLIDQEEDSSDEADRADALMDAKSAYMDGGYSLNSATSFTPPKHLDFFNSLALERWTRHATSPFDPNCSQFSSHSSSDRPAPEFKTNDGTTVKILYCTVLGFIRSITYYDSDQNQIIAELNSPQNLLKISDFDCDLASLSPLGVVCCQSNYISKSIQSRESVKIHFAPFDKLRLKSWTVEINQFNSPLAVTMNSNYIILALPFNLIVLGISGIQLSSANHLGSFLTVSSTEDHVMTVCVDPRNPNHFTVSQFSLPNLSLIFSTNLTLSEGISLRWSGFVLNKPALFTSIGHLMVFNQKQSSWVTILDVMACHQLISTKNTDNQDQSASSLISIDESIKLTEKLFIVGTSENSLSVLLLTENTVCPRSSKSKMISLPFSVSAVSSLSDAIPVLSKLLIPLFDSSLNPIQSKRINKLNSKNEKELAVLINNLLSTKDSIDTWFNYCVDLFNYISSENLISVIKELLSRKNAMELLPYLEKRELEISNNSGQNLKPVEIISPDPKIKPSSPIPLHKDLDSEVVLPFNTPSGSRKRTQGDDQDEIKRVNSEFIAEPMPNIAFNIPGLTAKAPKSLANTVSRAVNRGKPRK
ncbi:hypothetical protein RCL1_005234 [Eukaryota sp. TZLM3-RCL]